MPYLRVVRDKRGYETTYLLHAGRDGARQQSVIVYAFRSPGGVRVGRSPFEPEIRREIEARRPDITFDWDSLLSNRQLIDSTPDPRRVRRRPSGGAESAAVPAPAARRSDVPPAPRLVVPSLIEGETPELRMRFLAHWHGILCEQLPGRTMDPARREAVMALVNRLNPAGWLEPDEIAQGLQEAAEALEGLSRALSRRRRKGKRGGRRSSPGDSGPSDATATPRAEEGEAPDGGMTDELSDHEPEDAE